jgi:hypothetical protein
MATSLTNQIVFLMVLDILKLINYPSFIRSCSDIAKPINSRRTFPSPNRRRVHHIPKENCGLCCRASVLYRIDYKYQPHRVADYYSRTSLTYRCSKVIYMELLARVFVFVLCLLNHLPEEH